MYIKIDANGSAIQNELLAMTKQRTVPNIFVNGHHVGGCDNTLAAIRSGEFQRLLASK
jgi:glutaredoxin